MPATVWDLIKKLTNLRDVNINAVVRTKDGKLHNIEGLLVGNRFGADEELHEPVLMIMVE